MDKQENWIRNAIRDQKVEKPSADFTDKLMLALAKEIVPQTPPLITKNGWYLIGTFILSVILLSVFATNQLSYHFSKIAIEFPQLKLSPFLAVILMVVPVLVFVQTALIKKYFNSAISW